MAVTGVIAAGAIIGAGSKIYASGKSSRAAAKSQRAALAELQASKARAINYLKPYEQTGQLALSPLSGLLTGQQYDPRSGQSTAITQDQRGALFQESPGYQFQLDQTQQMLQRMQAANGTAGSGGAQKEIAQYTGGLASQQYNNYIDQLFQLAGSGQNAAMGQAQAETNFAGGIANAQVGIGQAQAGYYDSLGEAGQGLGSSLSGYGGLMAYQNQNPLSSAASGNSGKGQYNNNYLSNTGGSNYGLNYNPLTIQR